MQWSKEVGSRGRKRENIHFYLVQNNSMIPLKLLKISIVCGQRSFRTLFCGTMAGWGGVMRDPNQHFGDLGDISRNCQSI